MGSRLATRIGTLDLKNPVIAAPGEHLIDDSGLMAAIRSGAGAVVMKSTNESGAAKRQLNQAEYIALDPGWSPVRWDAPGLGDTVLTRSGLHPLPFDLWLAQMTRTEAAARAEDCLLVPSLVMGDLDAAVAHARAIQSAGGRVLELNIGTPYASQAAAGAVSTELDPARIRQIVHAIRAAISIPLWVKLSGQSERVTELARAAVLAGADSVVIAGRALGLVPDLATMRPVLGTSCGVGGFWNLPLTCHWLAEARAALGADQPLIGINGATSGDDVARMMLAGATAVGLSSAVMRGGFGVLTETVAALNAYCAAQGMTAAALVGRAADARQNYADLPILTGIWRNHIPAELPPSHEGTDDDH